MKVFYRPISNKTRQVWSDAEQNLRSQIDFAKGNHCAREPCHPQATDKKVSQLSVWLLILVAIGKNIPASFTDKDVFQLWLGQVGFDRSKLNAIAKAKKLFVSETCFRFCAIDLRISFLALAIASKKIIQNHQ